MPLSDFIVVKSQMKFGFMDEFHHKVPYYLQSVKKRSINCLVLV